MNNLVFDHFIEKSREGTYYSIPFEIQECADLLTVSYSYPKGESRHCNVVDLGLSDNQGRFLGWSGSARNSISVGSTESTPGYWTAEIHPGTWNILVGAYKIPEEGLLVKYEISYKKSQPGWLAGDLHMHSTASDGEYSSYELAQKAKEEGLDFIAVTDHNNYCGNFSLPSVKGLTILPGVEWTHYKGHINFFGVKAPFENSFIANSEEEMLNLIAQVRSNGALISVNHPKCPDCPCLWENDEFFDMIEVWNGPMRKANMDAVSWWHKLLLSGRRIPIVGGSDFHREKSPVRQGHPITFVYSESRSSNAIMEALRAGHSFITSSIRGVQLYIHNDSIQFGDTVPSEPGRLLHFSVRNITPGLYLQLITDKGVSAEYHYYEKSTEREFTIPEGKWKFAYLRAYYRIGRKMLLCAISNPVYFEKQSS